MKLQGSLLLCPCFYEVNQELAVFFVKGQMGNILGVVGHMVTYYSTLVSLTTKQLSCYSTKVDIDNTQTSEHDCV